MTAKTYSPIAVANAFLDIGRKIGTEISPMKLQKLVFFAHAWMLALAGRPLINENVKAWKFGPVINSVYDEFKNFGSKPITSLGTELVIDDGSINNGCFSDSFSYIIPMIPKNDEVASAVINAVWDTYGGMSALRLSDLTHQAGSAWSVARGQHQDGQARNFIIPNEVIRECMKGELGF